MSDFKEFFTKHAGGYSKSSSHASGSDLKSLVSMLSNRKYEKAVDIATGTGFTAIGISQLCDEVVGIDATPAMLDEAKKNVTARGDVGNITFMEGTAESTGLPAGSCDLVTCRRAAHHFEDKPAFLKEASRILKPGGILALVDFASPEQDTEGLMDTLEKIRDTSHIHAASESEWFRLFDQTGLKCTDSWKEIDKRPFLDWLYPVDRVSREGIDAFGFVNTNIDGLTKAGIWDPDEEKLIKERIILIATRQ